MNNGVKVYIPVKKPVPKDVPVSTDATVGYPIPAKKHKQ